MSDRTPIPNRPLIASRDELTVPILISRPGDESPMAKQWKREHPDWFVAGTYEYPPESRIDPNGPMPITGDGSFERSIAPIIAPRRKSLRPSAKDVGVPSQRPAARTNTDDDVLASNVRQKASDDVPIHDARHARRRPPVPVILPDGSTVEQVDRNGRRGPMVSPFADLSDVAAAGRAAGEEHRRVMQHDPETGPFSFLSRMASDLAHGGRFDYQRDGSGELAYLLHMTKRIYRVFVPVSNFNVGLWCQQAGLSLEETLSAAGQFARYLSDNQGARDDHGLVSEQVEMTRKGWQAGASGSFRSS